ncbi:MAG: DUF3592 domain-containing protein [Pseudomonadota bacterium]
METGPDDRAPNVLRLFLRMGGWGVVLLGILVLTVSILSASRLSIAKQFEDQGRSAKAEVTDKQVRQKRASDGSVMTTFHVEFRFSTFDGKELTLEQPMEKPLFDGLGLGSTLPVRYLADTPSRVELDIGLYRRGGDTLQRIALIGGVVWLGLLWLVGGWAVSAVQAREQGRLEEVEVVKVQRTTWRMNRQRLFRLVWRNAEGQEGQSMLNWRRSVARFRPGDKVEAYRGARHMWWVGDVGERSDDARS